MGLLYLNRDSTYNTRAELFANGEQGLWLDPSDMTAGKAGWRRNLLTYSEQYSNTVWGKEAVTVTANSTVAPNGTTTADTITEDGTTARHRIYQSFAHTAGVTYTYSVEAKLGTGTRFLIINANTAFAAMAAFNLSLGTVHSTTSGSASITNLGNGWYRCSVVGTATATNTTVTYIQLDNDGVDGTYAGDSSSSLILGGSQIEIGSTPTEYQPITDFSTEFKQAFPTHTLYQDSNGVTPCTAAGDPVGLILDQSRGGLSQIGAEIVTNGGFDGGSSWTIAGGTPPTISGGTANWSATTGSITSSSSIVSGKWYRLTFDLVSYTSGTLAFRDGTTNTTIATTGAVAGPKSFIILATGNNIAFHSFSAATLTIDNISVREVPGNHAYQTTSASRPTLARIPSSGRRNLLTRTEEFDNAAWAKTTATLTAGVADPNGGNTAWTFTAAGASSVVNQIFNGLSGSLTNSIWIRRRTGTGVVRFYTGAASATQQMQSVITNDWQRLSTATGTASGASDRFGIILETSGDAVDIWRPQLETGSTATSYQKVVATTDVTESGVSDLWHLVFDGSDDSLTTNSISFNTWTQDTRRNLLVDTESFGVSNWTKIAVTANDNATTDPNGGDTACRLVETTAASEHRLDLTTGLSFTSGLTYTVSIYAKAAERTRIRFGFSELFQMPGRAYFDLSNGTTDNAIAGTTAAIENAGNGWYRCSVTCTCTGNITSKIEVNLVSIGTTVNYTGDTANGVLVWGAQLESGSLTAYQRVGTDEMTVIAGVRKLSDAASAAFVEASADAGSNNGAFAVYAPRTVNSAVEYRSRGTLSVTVTEGNVSPAPSTLVFTGQSDISQDSVVVRKNGVQAGSSASDQGTGNYGNYQLFIGRRNQATLPFNGHLYQLIIRGKTTPTGKLLEAERFTARKTGVSF